MNTIKFELHRYVAELVDVTRMSKGPAISVQVVSRARPSETLGNKEEPK